MDLEQCRILAISLAGTIPAIFIIAVLIIAAYKAGRASGRWH